ncbi:MAG: hypothetical protein IPK22_21335 [Verrucomicrobiaceae bacterium]|nr:hypothetical protein [Verrucomicrobiaceae bacterium]
MPITIVIIPKGGIMRMRVIGVVPTVFIAICLVIVSIAIPITPIRRIIGVGIG